MSGWKKLASAAAGGDVINVEDVFSTYLYEGNQTARTITNGIDLAGEGGLTWITPRTTSAEMQFIDSERGVSASSTPVLISSLSNGQISRSGAVTAYNSDGFDLGTYDATNYSGRDMVSWTFRKAPGFFDVVTYSGSSSAQSISHNLGVVPAVIIVKQLNSSGRWTVYHKDASPTGNPENGRMALNTTDAWAEYPTVSSFQNLWNLTAPTSTHFTVGTDATTGASGSTYVAYLFASNESAGTFGATGDQDIIKCGGFTTTSTGTGSVDIGFEPQWMLIKASSQSGTSWNLADNMRGWGFPKSSGDTTYKYLYANSSTAEGDTYLVDPTSTGFNYRGAGGSRDYVYIAIRRPMKTPETASEVFDVQEVAGNGSARTLTTGTRVDFVMTKANDVTYGWRGTDRLRGNGYAFAMDSNSSEYSNLTIGHQFDAPNNNGFKILSGSNPYNASGYQYNHWAWTRAPSFFDIVAWEGTGSYTTTFNHNLGVTPEMIWVKNRSLSEDWAVYHKAIGTYYGPSGTSGGVLRLDANSGVSDTGVSSTSYWRDQEPDADAFYLGNQGRVNGSGYAYAAYLFASLDGVSKVGSYTGTGSDQTIDCGFSNGASFVLVKRYDTGSSSWHIWDSARGITTGNDSTHFLDLSQQENTSSNYIDPHNSGFTLKSSFTATNASGGDYIFYAIAAI